MMMIYFLYGLSFGGLGLAAYLQMHQSGDFPLKKQLPWLAAFGIACSVSGFIDMFLTNQTADEITTILKTLRMVVQPLTGLLLLIFGWGILKLDPLPAWTIFIPGILIVPIAYIVTFAATTFITPSPIEIPIDIWSRYLFYLPGSIIAGIGFLRLWDKQRKLGYYDVANLMLGAGVAFLFEAFVVGLIVPAAPYGPASYYNYDRVTYNALIGEHPGSSESYGLTAWLDYKRVLQATGLPIQFWRMVSAFAVTFFVVRGLGVFEAIRKREVDALQHERDEAEKETMQAQIIARQTAESWTDALVSINRRIAEFENVDGILLYIIENAKILLHSDFIGLALLNEDRSQLMLKCYSNELKTERLFEPLLIENPIIWQSVRSNNLFCSQADSSIELLEQVCLPIEKSASSIAVVPIELDNIAIGALWIARCEAKEKPYSQTDLIWLECMADLVVVAIQHGLMASQIQSLSIVEERARIAREMHDGLAQVLGYLNLQVQTLEALHEQGNSEEFINELHHMRQAIQLAHADVRENILSLRTTLANDTGLIPAVEEYLKGFEIQTGIETELSVNVIGELNLSSVAEVQLVCILQEALTNVRKHACASQVLVSIVKDDQLDFEHVQMEIRDNGVGFITSDSKRHFGLQTMRERATSVNGTLLIHSVLEKGTTVLCDFPCLQHEESRGTKIALPVLDLGKIEPLP